MKNITVELASFKQAFEKFLSLCGYNESILDSFKELKEKGVVTHTNETEYWCGNHHSSYSIIKMYRIETPCLFYVVEEYYSENSDNSHNNTNKWIFVP